MMPGIFVLAAKATQYNVYALPWSSEPHLFDQGTSPSCPPRSISSYIPLSPGDLCHILLILQAPPHSCPYILHFLIFKLKKKLDCDDQISPVLNNLLICIARQLITTSCPITTYLLSSDFVEITAPLFVQLLVYQSIFLVCIASIFQSKLKGRKVQLMRRAYIMHMQNTEQRH